MARRLTEKFESSRVGDFPVNRLLWSISESNRHPAVRLLPRGTFFVQTALHAKAKAEAGYRFYAPYDKISRESPRGRLLLSSPPGDPSEAHKRQFSTFDPHSGHRTDGGLPMMNQSAGSEVVGTLAPDVMRR